MPMFHVGELQPTSVLLSPEEPSPASWSVASAADSGALAGAATGAIVRAFSLRRVVSVAAAAPRRRSAPLMSTFIAFSPVSLDFFCVTFVGRSCCFSPPRGLMAVRPIKLIFSRAQRNCVSALCLPFAKFRPHRKTFNLAAIKKKRREVGSYFVLFSTFLNYFSASVCLFYQEYTGVAPLFHNSFEPPTTNFNGYKVRSIVTVHTSDFSDILVTYRPLLDYNRTR